MAASRHLGFGETGNSGNSAIRSAVPENPTLGSHEVDRTTRYRYGHLKFSKMAASRHLGFGPTGSRSIRSADLEYPTLEPNLKLIG